MANKKDPRGNAKLPRSLYLEMSHYALDEDITLHETIRRGWELLRTSTESLEATGTPVVAGRRDWWSKDKWHAMLDKVLNSNRKGAIQANLLSFSEGIDAENSLAELKRRMENDGLSTDLHAGKAGSDSDERIEGAFGKATEAKPAAERALRLAKDLQGNRDDCQTGPSRGKSAATGTGSKTIGRGADRVKKSGQK